MRRRIPRRAFGALLVAAGFAAGVGVCTAGLTSAAFSSTTTNSTNVFNAAADLTAPTASAETVGRTADCSPGTPGFIKQGATYFVYANVADTGNPASGTSTVNSNTSTLTTGATATSLASGSFSTGSISYNWRTASVTANAALSAGSYAYSLTSTDVAANSGTQSGFSVTVDNTALAASDVQAVNGTGVVSRPDLGDVVTYTFTEPASPCSILSGWSGTSASVVARITNNGANDLLTVWNAANTSQLPMGSLGTQHDYTNGTITFGASGTASSMVVSGNTIRVTLGTPSTTSGTQTSTATMQWTPSATATTGPETPVRPPPRARAAPSTPTSDRPSPKPPCALGIAC